MKTHTIFQPLKVKLSIILIGFFISITGLQAQKDDVIELEWPREVTTSNGVLTYYQPQIDSYAGNMIEGRCAISLKPEKGDMLFGAFWFRAFMQTDKAARTAVLDQIDVLDLQFPGLTDSTEIAENSAKIGSTLENMDIVISLDRLIASLDEAEGIQNLADNIDNTPPIIYFRTEPTILITVDGDPIWKELKDQNLKYVVNSPFFIAQDLKSKNYYISGGGKWYTTKTPPDNWVVTGDVASNVKKFAEANAPKDQNTSKDEKEVDVTPKPLVVYKPSELIVTGGEPDYKPIKGTNLLFVANSEDDIIMDINTQMHYVLLAGRWYKSKTLADGSWVFEDPKNLPADFKNIPADGEMANVRVSVPETDEAKDALLEQTIPQTAEVVRSEAKLEVHFDGDPQFKQIPNTDVSYSLNSDKSVLKINQNFYCVDNGIWFISNYPAGPWEVSDHRPDEVDQIPPSEPVYNTKYVYVYGSTPEVVYVGYLPGYTYSYVYNGVVVYGTGYHYPYWYGSVYYPRPVTFGYSVHYNPYTGWGFSMGFSYGWIGWGYHPYYRPYWGPCGYHAGYRNGYYNGYHHGYHNGYNRGVVDGYRAGSRNAYHNQRDGVRKTTTREQVARTNDISRASNRPNNMYTDKRGNVYERTKQGDWKERTNAGTRDMTKSDRAKTNDATKATRGEVDQRNRKAENSQSRETRQQTKPQTEPQTRPQTRPDTRPQTREQTKPQTRPQTQPQSRPAQRSAPQPNLNNSYENRQRGQQNYNRGQSFNAPPSRPATRPTVPAGGNRGGGGRRR